MLMIVGLGNPGKKYKNTWHNLGFLVIEEFKNRNNFSNFRLSKKPQAKISKGKLANQKIILAKPQTFMNNSGKSVKDIVNFYKLSNPSNLWIVHDDVDLPLSKIKISKKRGAAGHKGVESIIEQLKTKRFIRFRIGIKPKKGKPKNINKFVIQKFKKEERKIVEKSIKKTIKAIEKALKEGLDKAMTEYN